jgi:hypothetical protein
MDVGVLQKLIVSAQESLDQQKPLLQLLQIPVSSWSPNKPCHRNLDRSKTKNRIHFQMFLRNMKLSR